MKHAVTPDQIENSFFTDPSVMGNRVAVISLSTQLSIQLSVTKGNLSTLHMRQRLVNLETA
jgi:hypothetical protein